MFRRLIRKMAKCDNNSDDLGQAKAMEAEEAVFRQTEQIARTQPEFHEKIEKMKTRVSETDLIRKEKKCED